MMQNPTRAYEEQRVEFQSGRELEAGLLSRASRKMSLCAQGWTVRGDKEFESKLEEALLFNQKLWTFLQVELSSPDNPLPPKVIRDLLQLSQYVDRKTMGLFSGGELKDLQALIRINQEIASGLLDGIPSVEQETPAPNEAIGNESILNITA